MNRSKQYKRCALWPVNEKKEINLFDPEDEFLKSGENNRFQNNFGIPKNYSFVIIKPKFWTNKRTEFSILLTKDIFFGL